MDDGDGHSLGGLVSGRSSKMPLLDHHGRY